MSCKLDVNVCCRNHVQGQSREQVYLGELYFLEPPHRSLGHCSPGISLTTTLQACSFGPPHIHKGKNTICMGWASRESA